MDMAIRRYVVYVTVAVASLIALIVIVTVAVIPFVTDKAIPGVLENWGGLIIGFYFGSFVGLLKEWLGGQREDVAQVREGER